MKNNSFRWPISLLVVGLVGGLFAESLLFFRAHAAEAERSLFLDLKIIVFLEGSINDDRAVEVGKKISALTGTERAVYVSPEDALARIEARDPTVFRSVALMGENPLPGAFEVELKDAAIGSLPVWAERVRDFEEVEEVVFKPYQVRALMQMRFYERFANIVISLAVATIALWIAWCFLGFLRSGRTFTKEIRRELLIGGGVSASGALIGAAAAAALAGPASEGLIMGAVSWIARCGLLVGAALGGVAASLPEIKGARWNPFSGRERRQNVAVLAAASLLLPASGLEAASVRSKRRELKNVTIKLENQKKTVSAIRREKNKAQEHLKLLKRQRRTTASRVEELKESFREFDNERVLLDSKLESLSIARNESRRLIGEEVEGYRRISEGADTFYDSGALWEEALRRGAIREKVLYLTQLRMIDADSIGARQKAVLRVDSIQKKASREIQRLQKEDSKLKRSKKAVETVSKSASRAEKLLKSLESSARQLASLIRDLTKRSAKKGKIQSTTPWLSKGSLPAPVLGPVVEKFGKRRVPELKTWTIHNGIDIAARKGAEVRPVSVGDVIFAGPFRSYGNVIIVNHGRGFYSIYGHLSGLRRKKGDRVSTRTVLASVDGKRGRLYLEFRQGGKAFDPSLYLRSTSMSKR
ncbi:MAG: hypothetical protein COB53_00805 [Elusimicrobia bacterium]|nr:MAG: hypothetical protein COB53_00805 [Elusimicrobiota bacterium]